ncbi:MAG: hypothetical protein R3F59_12905 [Myxococcota bacterium]
MILLACTLASAQSVPDGDFESIAGWTDITEHTFYLGGGLWVTESYPLLAQQSTPARGAWSGLVETFWFDSPMGSNTFDIRITSAPFTVTHTALSYALIDAREPLGVALESLDGAPLSSGWSPGPASADSFEERVVDVSAACGVDARVVLSTFSYGDMLSSWSIDDVALSGDVCPAFLDGDGDGTCPRGTDLDGDGACDQPDEISAVPVDCEDGDPIIDHCLTITASPTWIRGGVANEVTVTGADPGETVLLLGSLGLGWTCGPVLGGGCVDLAPRLRVLASAPADGDGTAVLSFTPLHRPGFRTPHLQAAVDRGAASLRSQVLTLPSRPADGPPAVPGLRNGDFEDGATFWGPISEVGLWFAGSGGYEYAFDCAGPALDPAVGRGTGSLYGELVAGSGLWQQDCTNTARSWPVRVTHEVLSFARRGEELPVVVTTDDGVATPVSPLLWPAPDGFEEGIADVSWACGRDIAVELPMGEGTWWDDLALDGPVCPAYRDRDGDGRCADGVDLDGDGACVGAGETTGPPDPEPLARLLEDFEGDLAPWQQIGDANVQWLAYDVDPPGSSSTAMWIVPGDALSGAFWSGASVVVTHDTLALSLLEGGVGDWLAARLHLEAFDPAGSLMAASLDPALGASGPQRWRRSTLDLSAVCGRTVDTLALSFDGWVLNSDNGATWGYAHPDELWIDDVGLAGAPCPVFVDGDGDGLCREGVDLDGDGLCVDQDAGEPTPGTVQDLDEPEA